MIDYTKAAIEKTIADLKRFGFIFSVATEIFSIIYLIYAIAVGGGYLIANIILAVLSLSYLIFYVTTNNNPNAKAARVLTKAAYKWVKLGLKAFTLGVTIYGIYVATDHLTLVSVLMAAAMTISWTLNLVLTVTINYFASKAKFIMAAMEADFENIMRPVEKVGNFIKKVRGEEIEEKPAPDKTRILLDSTVQEYREKKKAERLAKTKERLRKREEAIKERKLQKAKEREEKRAIRNKRKQGKKDSDAQTAEEK